MINLVLVLLQSIKKGSKEKIFLRDVLAVHRNDFNIVFLIIIIIIIIQKIPLLKVSFKTRAELFCNVILTFTERDAKNEVVRI